MYSIRARLSKLIATILAVLMLAGNPAFALPVSAATGSTDSSMLSTDQKATQALNQLIPYYLQGGKRQGPEWLKTTDINLSLTENYKPNFTLETVQPFGQATKDGHLLFWQGRYKNQGDANATANLGIGWRKLSDDKTGIFGLNAFYDHSFEHDLSRIGIGAEHFGKTSEIRANLYLPVSGDREIGKTELSNGILHTYERAVLGFDYELGSSLTNAPWLSLYASGYYWDNKHNEEETGYKLRSTAQLFPRLSLELGYTKSNLDSGSPYAKIQFQFSDTLKPSLQAGDISHKLLQKVQRSNDVKTETFTAFVSYTGNLSVTVTNSNSQPIQGVQVQAYQNRNPIGNAAVTDVNGRAVFDGLDVGTYTVHATYFSVTADSVPITVQKDQTTNAAISLPITGGNAVVNVLDAQGQAVVGASVTAEAVGGSRGSAPRALFRVTATTDADGVARFASLPPGNYRFTVTYDSMTMRSLTITVPDGSSENATVVLPASGGNIVAVVTDAANQVAVNGATVELLHDGTVIDTKTTGNDGTAIFSGLSPSNAYNMRATAFGATNVSPAITPEADQTIAANIALDIRNSATITVSDGASPVSGATVSVTVNGAMQTLTTNASGQVMFTNLPTGTYAFSAEKADYTGGNASVMVTNGATSSETITITRQTGNATITVSDGASPVSGATVSVTVNGATQTLTTNASGQVTFTNLPTGTYAFSAEKADYTGGNASVTVTNGATVSETITITRQTGSATITVSDGASPVSGATVSVTVNGATQTLTTNASGQATFTNLPTGTYAFSAEKADYTDGNASVTVTNGATATGTVSITRQTSTVTITVNDGVNPISGATVSITGGAIGETETTNASGQVVFTDLPNGNYVCWAEKADYYGNSTYVQITNGAGATGTVSITRKTGNATITVVDGLFPIEGATVTVTVDGTPRTLTTGVSGQVTFTNLPTGTYAYTAAKTGYTGNSSSVTIPIAITANSIIAITRQTGNATITVNDGASPVSGATVSVTVNGATQTLTTDASGQVTFANLPTGTYAFSAEKTGYTGGNASVTVTNGATASETITITRQTGNATITVVNDGASPVSGATVSVTVNGATQTLTTNASGQVTFTNLPTGTYAFSAEKTDYTGGNASVTVTNGATATGTVSITRQTSTVTITVNDGVNPVSGATVSITGGAIGETETTNASGQVVFTDLPNGNYSCWAEKADYYGNSTFVQITNGAGATGTVSITRKTGNVTITVSDGTSPVSGATVSVTVNGATQTLTTNASGQVTFTNLPTGTYAFSAEKTDYTGGNASVTVTNGTTASETITITRQTGNATITVVDGLFPIEGATVTVTVDGTPWTLTTGVSGQVTFYNLPTGTYTYTAAKTGYTSNSGSMTITNGATANGIIFITRQTGNATITVSDGANPVSGATVSVTVSGATQTLATDASGQVTFTNLPTSTYAFSAVKTGYTGGNASVTVTNGATANGIIFITRQTGNATITVSDGANPVSGATVSVTVSGATQNLTTDASGQVTFTNLPTDTYTFTAVMTGYNNNTCDVTVTNSSTATGTISITGQTGNATINVINIPFAIEGVTVTVTVDGTPRTLTTGVSGQVTFTNLPAGTYTYTVEKTGYNANTGSVTVTSGQTTTTSIFITRQTGDATITVNDGTNPIGGAIVSITGNGIQQTATTSEYGLVTFSVLPTGTYAFAVTKEDYTSNFGSVTVTNGATSSETITITRQTGNATITVIEGANPVSGAAVSVVVNGATQTLTTNGSGQVTFTNLPTGTYAFSAAKTGYAEGSSNVTVTNGSTATGTVSITRQTGNATITVYDDGANPIIGVSVSISGNGIGRSGTTNASGQVVFTDLPTGNYICWAEKDGYDGNPINVTITNGAAAIGNISLTMQMGNATITVIDGTNPVSGATVSVTVNGATQTLMTNGSGQVTFTNLPAGTYFYTAEKTGYSGNGGGVTVTSGQTTTESISITRQTGNATITIYNGANPVSDVTVSVMVDGVPRDLVTDVFGSVMFVNLPTGTYTFTAEKIGYTSNSGSVTVEEGTTFHGTISIARQTGYVDILVNDGANPIDGATVSATVDGMPETAITTGSGWASFVDIPTGTYTFMVTKDGYVDNSISVTVENGTTATATISMSAVPAGGTVVITVRDAVVPSVKYSNIQVSVLVDSTLRTELTNASGQATFTNLPEGTYVFTAELSNVSVSVTNGGTAYAYIEIEGA